MMIKEIKVLYKPDIESAEIVFWKNKSSEEKLSAVQTLREQYIDLFNKQEEYLESRKRLRRVYRIIKSK